MSNPIELHKPGDKITWETDAGRKMSGTVAAVEGDLYYVVDIAGGGRTKLRRDYAFFPPRDPIGHVITR